MFPPDSTTHGRKDRAHGQLLTPSELGGTALATRRHSNFRDPKVKKSRALPWHPILPGGEIVEKSWKNGEILDFRGFSRFLEQYTAATTRCTTAAGVTDECGWTKILFCKKKIIEKHFRKIFFRSVEKKTRKIFFKKKVEKLKMLRF